jgi:hypothetical protein
MHSTLNPKQTDPHDVLEIAPDVVLVARADKEFSNLAHDAMSRPWDPQTHIASDFSAGPSVLAVDTTFRAAAVNDVQILGDRPSIGTRAIRAFIGFLLAVCIGVAGIVWQAYGDAAKQIIAGWLPQLAVTSSPPPENPALPEQPSPPPVQASAAKAAPTQPVPPAQTAPEGVAPTTTATFTPESAQLLQSMAGDLARAGQEIEQLKTSIAQLKASQEQMSRDIAKVSGAKISEAKTSEAKTSEARASSEQNLRSRVSAALRRSAAAPARRPMPPFPPPQAAATRPLPQTVAPAVPPQPEPQPLATAQPQTELVPRPPMPVR